MQPIAITSARGKREALEAMRARELQMAKNIDTVVQTGGLAFDDDDPAVRGCAGRFSCGLLGRRRRTKIATGDHAQQQQQSGRTGIDARLFGAKGKQGTATDRLNHAAESVGAHAEQLAQRAADTRAKAKQLFAAGKRAEATAALKRAKGLEKQLETATATHAALERQVDVLAESALQKEVASALSASVASTKKKTKGLMGKTEEAVDGATELKDFAEDIAQTLGTLQTEAFDEDELLEELEAMQGGDVVDAADAAPVAAATPVAPAPPAQPTAVGVTVDAASYPKVPARVVERRKLLSDDGAGEEMGAYEAYA